MPAVYLEGARVAYEERGKGEPVVLLHGWNGTRKQWLLNLKALAPRFRAIAPDLPGFGESEEGVFPYTLDGMSDFLEAFREALRLPRFDLVGHSMGGCIAVRHAALHAGSVKRLVLVSTPTRSASMGLSGILPGTRSLVSGTYRFRSEAVLKWMFYRSLLKPEHQDLDFVRANVKASALSTRRALGETARMLRGMDLSADLGTLGQPTLVVFGSKDKNVNPREALRQRDLLARPYMAVLNSCAHCPPYERPDLFNTVLLDFLQDEGVEMASREGGST